LIDLSKAQLWEIYRNFPEDKDYWNAVICICAGGLFLRGIDRRIASHRLAAVGKLIINKVHVHRESKYA